MRGGGLKELRRAAGFSQEGLARTAECSLSMVRLLEAGYRPHSSEVLDRIAAALAQPGGRAGPSRQHFAAGRPAT